MFNSENKHICYLYYNFKVSYFLILAQEIIDDMCFGNNFISISGQTRGPNHIWATLKLSKLLPIYDDYKYTRKSTVTLLINHITVKC